MSAPQIAQVALCTADLPRSVQLYTRVFGFADAGGKALWGPAVGQIQDLGDDAAFVLWWLVGRQDFMQLELFSHTRPAQRPLPADWRPSDLGWVRWGLAVPDFDAALQRLGGLGITTITDPVTVDGLRRVCFRDPATGTVVEVFEEGTATPGGVRPRHYDLVPAVVYAALSVPDLERARSFYVDTLGLVEEPGTVLHEPDSEHLWGLEGARRDSFVARGGDVFLEVVRYDEPVGRPPASDRRLSDQGMMNIAVGFRDQTQLDETYQRAVANGYRPNSPAPRGVGGTYVNDGMGTTAELLVATREFDPMFGFTPGPRFGGRPRWPQPAVGPARED